jgi:hypothetical protein
MFTTIVKAQTRQGDAQAKGGEDDELASKSQVIIQTNRCLLIPCEKDTLYSRRRHALTPSYIILLGPGTCARHNYLD